MANDVASPPDFQSENCDALESSGEGSCDSALHGATGAMNILCGILVFVMGLFLYKKPEQTGVGEGGQRIIIV